MWSAKNQFNWSHHLLMSCVNSLGISQRIPSPFIILIVWPEMNHWCCRCMLSQQSNKTVIGYIQSINKVSIERLWHWSLIGWDNIYSPPKTFAITCGTTTPSIGRLSLILWLFRIYFWTSFMLNTCNKHSYNLLWGFHHKQFKNISDIYLIMFPSSWEHSNVYHFSPMHFFLTGMALPLCI